MSLSLYDVSVPAFMRGFANLTEILKKAEAFADERGIAHKELLEARLIEDMLPLTGQVQRASDAAKFVPVRLGVLDNLPMTDDEVTFAELHQRIERTERFLGDIVAASMADRDDVKVAVKNRSGELIFDGRGYVLGFALPNFYFHLTTAYAILRHKGVPIGKMDYLGSF